MKNFATIRNATFAAIFALLAIVGRADAQLSASQTWAGTAGGSVNALTMSVPNISSFNDLIGVPIRFLPAGVNTSSVQANISGLGLKNVLKQSSAGLAAFTGAEFQTGQMAEITYDGTEFVWSTNASTASAPIPQVYLTPCKQATPVTGCTAGTLVPTGDVTAATILYAEPDGGSIVPIWNGSVLVPTPVTEVQMTLTLGSSNVANAIYDVCIFNNGGTPTIVTTPAWSVSTIGSGTRGTGAGTPELAKVNGLWVNAVMINGLNGGTTYSNIPANQCTVIASILIDNTNGQVTFNRTYGQSRRWAAWNFYNRLPLYLKVGDSTSSWSPSATLGPVRGQTANSAIVFVGLQEETLNADALEKISYTQGGSGNGGVETGVGFNSTTVASGALQFNQQSSSAATNGSFAVNSKYVSAPFLGAETITFLEASTSSGGQSVNGGENNNVMTVQWRG